MEKMSISSGKGTIFQYIYRRIGGRTYVSEMKGRKTRRILTPGRMQRVGVLVGFMVGQGKFAVGSSLTNFRSGDEFDPEVGFTIAQARVMHRDPVPSSIRKEYDEFVLRATKYFKGCTFHS